MHAGVAIQLFALTLAVFGIGTTEFAIMGLLPEIAADLRVSIPKASLLVSGYALGVAVGGPILAILTNGMQRKSALLLLMGVFVVGHVLTAIASSYGPLMTARIVTSFCHGAFVGIASVVAVDIVPADRRATAIAVVWAGFSASSIIGVPAGTALGHALGWRSTFWAIAVLGTVASVLIAFLLQVQNSPAKSNLASEFKVLARPQVQLALLLSALVSAAAFGVYTFIAPMLLIVTNISSENLPWVLLAFGVGGTIGMFAGARLADWKLGPTLVGIVAAQALIYLVLLYTVSSPGPAAMTVFVWGMVFYAPASAIQLRLVNAAREAPNLASTLNQSAFNVGNVVGPAIGAAAMSSGLGFGSLPWIGAILALLALSVAAISVSLERGNKTPHRA